MVKRKSVHVEEASLHRVDLCHHPIDICHVDAYVGASHSGLLTVNAMGKISTFNILVILSL